MRLFMILGMMILIIGFVIALFVAATAGSVYSNPVTAIDAAATGSALLSDLAAVHAAETWLEALKFVGVAFLFLAIINGLSTIIFALTFQKKAIPAALSQMPSVPVPVAASGDQPYGL